MSNLCKNVENPPSVSLKSEALNCVENLLIREEISIDKYELITKVIELLGVNNMVDLGDGIALQLADISK